MNRIGKTLKIYQYMSSPTGRAGVSGLVGFVAGSGSGEIGGIGLSSCSILLRAIRRSITLANSSIFEFSSATSGPASFFGTFSSSFHFLASSPANLL